MLRPEECNLEEMILMIAQEREAGSLNACVCCGPVHNFFTSLLCTTAGALGWRSGSVRKVYPKESMLSTSERPCPSAASKCGKCTAWVTSTTQNGRYVGGEISGTKQKNRDTNRSRKV